MLKLTQPIKKILIIQLAFIGDVVLSIPTTRALRVSYPDTTITMLTVPTTSPVAELNPYIDEVCVYDKKGRHRNAKGLIALISQLRAAKYDLAVCMNCAPRNALLAWAAGIKIRLGWDAQHAKWLLTHATSPSRVSMPHRAQHNLQILEALNIITEDYDLIFRSIPKLQQYVRDQIKPVGDKPIGILCPSGRNSLKSLSNDKYITVLKQLRSKVDFYIIGVAEEKDNLKQIAQKAGLPSDHVLAGTFTLQELVEFIRIAKVMVTVDTGPLHIAQAVGTPVVALFGPTDPKVWGPRGRKDQLIYNKQPCSPCTKKEFCDTHHCMEDIDSAMIIEAVEKILISIAAPEYHVGP